MKKILMILLAVMVSVVGWASFTPEVLSFSEQVFSPVSFYTGQTNTSIPLYTVKCKDISIPITLDYIGGSGLKTTLPYSSVGYGWRLNAGGCIVRTVNFFPDESTADPYTNGFLHAPENIVKNEDIRTKAANYFSTTPPGYKLKYEYAPDIFTFNFLGYSGYFLLGYDNKVHVQSKDIFDVKITKLQTVGSAFQIIMTDKHGIAYYFGFTGGSVEVNEVAINGIPHGNAWYLSKIVTPTGNVITFEYDGDGVMHAYRENFAYRLPYTDQISKTYPVILSKINFDNGSIKVSHKKEEQGISTIKLIDKIEVLNKNSKSEQTIQFTHKSQALSSFWFLQELQINQGVYKFSYHDTHRLPSSSTLNGDKTYYNYDYWGYYNGKERLSGEFNFDFDPFLNSLISYPYKEPSEEHAKIGILTSIQYPTKGMVFYEYEAHDYSYIGRNAQSGYYLNYLIKPQKTGGLRIAKITLGGQVKRYKYVESFDPNSPDYNGNSPIGFSSSGILYKEPALLAYEGKVMNELSAVGEPQMTYSKVIELNEDKSYTVYQMNSLHEFPDQPNTNKNEYYTGVAYYFASKPYELTSLFDKIPLKVFVNAFGKQNSCALERGEMRKKLIYNNKNSLIKEVRYTYSQAPDRYTNYVAGLNGFSTPNPVCDFIKKQYELSGFPHFTMLHSYCSYVFPVLLEKEEIIDYTNSDISTITEFQYDQNRQISSIKYFNSSGTVKSTTYKYPYNFTDAIYKTMVSKHILSPIVIQEVSEKQSVLKKITDYTLINNQLCLPLNNKIQINDFPIITKTNYLNYDNLGNVTCSITNGIPSSYIWGYDKQYPVAKIIGATYADVISKITATELDNISKGTYNDADMRTVLGKIRTAFTGNKAVQITTYTYTPLVGMTSETDTNGVTIYYEYDSFGRLMSVKDTEKKQINKYLYNYKK